jgi:hypothetical protein
VISITSRPPSCRINFCGFRPTSRAARNTKSPPRRGHT